MDFWCSNSVSSRHMKCCNFYSIVTAWTVAAIAAAGPASSASLPPLRFNEQGKFKILQIADMHYANGVKTECKDVRAYVSCSDLNTTAFVSKLLAKEKPDLVVFTGDNIDSSADNAAQSMDEAFAPVIAARIPWAAILGNHDDESNLGRPDLMSHIMSMEYSLARAYPKALDGDASGQESYLEIDGVGNYNLEVFGPSDSMTANRSLLNLFFLDSGAYSKVRGVYGYDWIRASQQVWFQRLSKQLSSSAPGLAYFHIPLPEYEDVRHLSIVTGQHQEDVSSPRVNSGFFTSMLEAGSVKAAFVGHDHVNDYCGNLWGLQLCYAGGTGYHGYGKVGWARRARVVVASLGQADNVQLISTWKDLDDKHLTRIHEEVVWDRQHNKASSNSPFSMWKRLSTCSIQVIVGVVTGMGIPMLIAIFVALFLCQRYRRLKAGYVRVLEPSAYKI